jgi:hypothetical protein
MKKPLTAKQKKALEIGSVLRTLMGCIGNLERMQYTNVLEAAKGSGLHTAQAVSNLHLAVSIVRNYNSTIALQNKREREAAKLAEKEPA